MRLRAELQSGQGFVGQLQQTLRRVAEQASQAEERRCLQAEQRIGRLQQSLADLEAQERAALAAGAGVAAGEARLLRTRNVLLGKLISNWQKQTLGRAVGGWLCSLEALRMDRILLDSDKYLSMDSSIDDLLNDALSKRRARSMLTSSSITVCVVTVSVVRQAPGVCVCVVTQAPGVCVCVVTQAPGHAPSRSVP